MGIRGSRVAVIGGSIAGCAAAEALRRAGCDVEVFERSPHALQDRGSGIAIPNPLREQLVASGYLPDDYAHCRLEGRHWVHADGSGYGRLLYFQRGPMTTNNWSVLWRNLRRLVPDDRYHAGVGATQFAVDADGATVRFSDGSEDRFDLLVGADGYRSAVRRWVQPSCVTDFAGYVLWRGNYPEERAPDRAALDRLDADRAWLTIAFDGGHGVLYPIPDFDDGVDVGSRRVNWAVYAPTPDGLQITEPSSIPPGRVTAQWYASLEAIMRESFPPDWEPIFRETSLDEVSIQPIYDEAVDAYVKDRALLIGDAATITRPHTGSGATKALQDALLLEELARDANDWDEVLPAYSHERATTGNTLVEVGRRIGHAQVERTPDWSTMTPERIEAWTKATLAGESLYLYGAPEPAAH